MASEGTLAPKDFLTKDQGTVGVTTLQMSKLRLERMDDVLKAIQPVGGAAMIYPLLTCPGVVLTGSFLGIPTVTQTHTHIAEGLTPPFTINSATLHGTPLTRWVLWRAWGQE